jgi:hypothetical protein
VRFALLIAAVIRAVGVGRVNFQFCMHFCGLCCQLLKQSTSLVLLVLNFKYVKRMMETVMQQAVCNDDLLVSRLCKLLYFVANGYPKARDVYYCHWREGQQYFITKKSDKRARSEICLLLVACY